MKVTGVVMPTGKTTVPEADLLQGARDCMSSTIAAARVDQ